MLTVSLELAKKMKELGWSKTTFLSFDHTDRFYLHEEYGDNFIRLGDYTIHNGTTVGEFFPAPTAQEILDELPTIIDDERRLKLGWIGHFHETKEWSVMIRFYREQVADVAFVNKNFAEALGQLWCWCKENGYLDANHKE